MDAHQRRSRMDIPQHQGHGFFLAPVGCGPRVEMAFKAHNAELSPACGKVGLSHFAKSEIGTHASIIEGGGNILLMALRYPEQLFYSFLTQEQSLLLACEITEFDRSIRKQKIQREHPEWCEMEVINEIIRHAFKIKSETIPEALEKHLQQRVEEWRAHQSE
jgi:hypothetical protein